MSLKRKQYVVLMLMGIGLVLIMTGAVKAWGFIEGAGFLMMLSGFAADFALLAVRAAASGLGNIPGNTAGTVERRLTGTKNNSKRWRRPWAFLTN